jgi:hypothetical protein
MSTLGGDTGYPNPAQIPVSHAAEISVKAMGCDTYNSQGKEELSAALNIANDPTRAGHRPSTIVLKK